MNIIVFVCYKMFKKFLCIMKNQFFLTIDLMDKWSRQTSKKMFVDNNNDDDEWRLK
jgi:hypothetical protein